MNSDPHTEPNRIQDQLADSFESGPASPTGAEKSAAANRELENQDTGPMTSPEQIADEIAEARRNGITPPHGDPLGANNESERRS